MPEFDGLTTLRKSAFRRLRDAKHLLDPAITDVEEQGVDTRHTKGAMYLCGYAIECLFKAYLISQHPPSQRLSQVLTELRLLDPQTRDICGAAGHDLIYLLTLTQLEAQMDNDARKWMNLCAKWKSTWRYDPAPARRVDAETMIDAASRLVRWINTRL